MAALIRACASLCDLSIARNDSDASDSKVLAPAIPENSALSRLTFSGIDSESRYQKDMRKGACDDGCSLAPAGVEDGNFADKKLLESGGLLVITFLPRCK